MNSYLGPTPLVVDHSAHSHATLNAALLVLLGEASEKGLIEEQHRQNRSQDHSLNKRDHRELTGAKKSFFESTVGGMCYGVPIPGSLVEDVGRMILEPAPEFRISRGKRIMGAESQDETLVGQGSRSQC